MKSAIAWLRSLASLLRRRAAKATPVYRYNRVTRCAEQLTHAGWATANDQLTALLVIATRQTRPADNLTRLAAGVPVSAGRRLS